MPDSLLGFTLFVLLLAPGLTYYFQRELRAPTRSVSAFRETATVAVASVVFNVAVLALLGVVRVLWPEGTPDIGRLVREAGAYIKCEYRLVGVWSTGLLAFACLVAGLFGRFSPDWIRPSASGISFTSAWWELIRGSDRPAGHTVFVGCELDDGSYVSGEVLSFSHDVEETADRELVLRPPISYRAAGADEPQELLVSAFVVSARAMRFLTFTYVPMASAVEAARPGVQPE